MPEWGTEETYGLSERMAYRVAKRVYWDVSGGSKKDKISVDDILTAGFGQRDTERPAWFPTKRMASVYEDIWEDWTDEEKATLESRLCADIDPTNLYRLFRVSKEMANEISMNVFGKTFKEMVAAPKQAEKPMWGPKAGAKLPETPPAPEAKPKPERSPKPEPEIETFEPEPEPEPSTEPAKYDKGEFGPLDMKVVADRRFANRRWEEYGVRVDITKPANQTTVRILIFQEVQLRISMRNSNSSDHKVRKAARANIAVINTQFTKSAENLALLEKQYKMEPQQESLDAVIMRTREIRKDWRDTQIEHEMAIHNIYELYAQEHKIRLGESDDTEDHERQDVFIPEPGFNQQREVSLEFARRAIEASEKGDEKIVAEGAD